MVKRQHFPVIGEMSCINLKDIAFNEIKRILQRALVALGELSTHWDTMSRFFSGVNQLVETASISTDMLLKAIKKSRTEGNIQGTAVMRKAIESAASRLSSSSR